MNKSGVYKIQSICKPTRYYIGSSANIKDRWGCHLRNLKNNKHHSIKLQNHYNKHDKEDLLFSICVLCDLDGLLKIEQLFLDQYQPWFNIVHTAGSPRLGIPHTDEAKQKISNGNKNKKRSEEVRKKLSKLKKEAGIKPPTRLGCGKKVINILTGNIYNSIRVAAENTSMKYSTFRSQLNEEHPNTTDFKLVV